MEEEEYWVDLDSTHQGVHRLVLNKAEFWDLYRILDFKGEKELGGVTYIVNDLSLLVPKPNKAICDINRQYAKKKVEELLNRLN